MESEEPLLLPENKEKTRDIATKWAAFGVELNRVNFIALPMMVVTVSQYLLRVSPMFMLGHLGELSLSSASIATSFANVTGFSVLFGMSSALETLCGQAYGAQQYQRVGTFTYGAILCLFVTCLPVSLLWIYTDKLLIIIGQDPSISLEAGKFAIRLIPTLFPYAILQSLLNLGNAGAALSIGISYWFNVILLVLYVKYSPTCKKTHASFSRDVFRTMGEFFRFAIPSAVMVCLEWWSFELVILLSGVLPNPQLETSVLSVCFTTTSLHYHIPYSFGAAASTLVSNELGAGKPQAARIALCAVLVLSIAEFVIASTAIFICRRILGYAFSNEKEVVFYVKEMVPFLCMSIIVDSLQAVLSGVARGSGWQHIGAYVNLGAYYLVGIPVALVLGFVLDLKGKGLWSGLVAGATVQSISLSLITGLTNWEDQAMKARKRVFADKIPARKELMN
ncbi:MATE efflux family protein [Abeliophyllum distichum]|uniref:Protein DETOXIFICATION n=1 Tax=Abeliophyllum distichum TaxID=126358 RepID=A0ABD1V4Y7_9LAMI